MKIIRWINIITLLITLVVNYLANALPLNNLDTGQISDSYPVLFTPAGYVFSIWGLIYLALIGFAVYQALPAQSENPGIKRIGLWFSAANIFNAAWIFAWHYQVLVISEILMLGLLVSLLVIYTRLGIGKTSVSLRESIFTHFPFSLYLGWISVATIANTSIMLFDAGWNGFGLSPEIWTILVLTVGALLGILMVRFRNAITYPLVIMWAFVGIYAKPTSPDMIATAAGTAALIVLIYLVFSMLRARQLAMLEARKDRSSFS
jgi:benzodiazapine receptor